MSIKSFAHVCVLAAAAVSLTASAAALTENFDTMTPAGWTVVNRSSPIGINNWFQGNPIVFSAQSGAAGSYAGVNFNSGAGISDLSDWLITPTMSFNNGDVLSFYARTIDAPFFADALEVRFSNVGGVDVGISATSVGSFGSLLVSINPNLTPAGFPNTWTQFNYTFSGLSGSTDGAIGFRYVVPNGGPAGPNSDYIGIDTVRITAAPSVVPEPSSSLLLLIGLGALGARRLRAKLGA